MKTNPKLWFYLVLGVLAVFLLYEIVVLKIFLEGMGVIHIDGFRFEQLHFFITHLVIVLVYLAFLVVYFIEARKRIDIQKVKTVKKGISITGFIFSLLALVTFILPFIPAIFWLLGIILSMIGLFAGFENSRLPRLAFAASIVSGIVMLVFPYIMMLIYLILGIGIFFNPIPRL